MGVPLPIEIFITDVDRRTWLHKQSKYEMLKNVACKNRILTCVLFSIQIQIFAASHKIIVKDEYFVDIMYI